jgi:MFS family permease
MDQVTRGWLMYDLTGSAAQLGLVVLVQVAPLLVLSPIAGSTTDRWGRKSQLIISQLLNIPPAAVLGLLVILGHIEPWHLYATGLAAGIVQVFQNPARQALVPESVDPSRLTNAIALSSVAFNVCRSLGPALAGGIIAGFGAGVSYLIQAVIYALTTVFTVMLRLPNHAPSRIGGSPEERPSFVGSILEGWRYVGRHPTIRMTLLASSTAQFLGMSFTTLLPVFARDVLDVGAAGQGLLLTALGMGALGSAFLVATLGDTMPKGKLMMGGITVYGLLELGFSQSHSYLVSILVMGLLGVCHVAANALGPVTE